MPDDQSLPFVNSDLDRADKNFTGFMRTHYPVAFAFYIPANIIFAVSFLYVIVGDSLLVRLGPSVLGPAWLTAAAFPCLAVSLLYVVVAGAVTRTKMGKDFSMHFAAIMGYSFEPAAAMTSVAGDIFMVGRGARLSDVCSGTYSGHPVRVFEYQTMVGSGKHQTTVSYTVLEVQFPHALSEMRVIPAPAKAPRGFGMLDRTIDVHFSSPMQITLEGDFSKYFSVWAPQNTQIEDLEIMAPDFMAWLIDRFAEYGKIGFECHAEKLYVHIAGPINFQKIADFSALYALAAELIPKLDRVKPMGE